MDGLGVSTKFTALYTQCWLDHCVFFKETIHPCGRLFTWYFARSKIYTIIRQYVNFLDCCIQRYTIEVRKVTAAIGYRYRFGSHLPTTIQGPWLKQHWKQGLPHSSQAGIGATCGRAIYHFFAVYFSRSEIFGGVFALFVLRSSRAVKPISSFFRDLPVHTAMGMFWYFAPTKYFKVQVWVRYVRNRSPEWRKHASENGGMLLCRKISLITVVCPFFFVFFKG